MNLDKPHTTVDVPLDDWEPSNPTGKRVASVTTHYFDTQHPTLEKRVVEVETRDGYVYRFQRFADDEYLAFYNRENDQGEEFQRAASLPENVEAVREAVRYGELAPPEEHRQHAEEREHMAVDVDRNLLADGGLEQEQDAAAEYHERADCGHPVTQRCGRDRRRCALCGVVVA